jgi:hypothetical protein
MNGTNIEGQFREPTLSERAILRRLLEAEFPGKSKLAALLENVLVRTIDGDGGLELQTQVEGEAPVVKRVPVEAEGKDVDGAMIHLCLHVHKGKPVELEFFREDAQTVKMLPQPSEFELIVLPPVPKDGWASRNSC